MPRFSDLAAEFECPYQKGCPYLEGLSTHWVWSQYQRGQGEFQDHGRVVEEMDAQLQQQDQRIGELEQENARLQAQLTALHRRQFKARRTKGSRPTGAGGRVPTQGPSKKKRGAPVGHPGWWRPQPDHRDKSVPVAAPQTCPHCQGTDLQPATAIQEHYQEDIVLRTATEVTCFEHAQAYCARCDRLVIQAGPGELVGAPIGPVAKSTATFLRYDLGLSYRKISRVFAELFGLRFVPASAYGFDRQAVGRGRPLYEDLREKIQAAALNHADETHWRHDGRAHFVWYAGNADLALFHLDPHRSTEVAQGLLGQAFGGVLVADAYAAYNGTHPQDRQSCLAHLSRKAKELLQELDLLPARAKDPPAKTFCLAVKDLFSRACQTGQQFLGGLLSPDQAKKQEKKLTRQLKVFCQSPLKYPPVESFRQRLMGKEKKYLFTFLRHRGVPPTNNQAEQSLRPIVILRKVIQQTRGEGGKENHSVLQSLIVTAKRQEKPPRQFLEKLLTADTPTAQAALYRNSS
jgi:hypothetical protein